MGAPTARAKNLGCFAKKQHMTSAFSNSNGWEFAPGPLLLTPMFRCSGIRAKATGLLSPGHLWYCSAENYGPGRVDVMFPKRHRNVIAAWRLQIPVGLACRLHTCMQPAVCVWATVMIASSIWSQKLTRPCSVRTCGNSGVRYIWMTWWNMPGWIGDSYAG